MLQILFVGWRATFFALCTTSTLLSIILKSSFVGGYGIRQAMRLRVRWARVVLHGIGVRVKTEGVPPDFPCLLVCNHRSYLDPIVILRDVQGYPVSKAEVQHWPILGKGAKLSGILYLQREDAGSRISTLKAIAETLRNGYPVILFPEGTTSGLVGTLPFKKSAFQIAARFGFPVVPAAIHFEDDNDFWLGTQTLFSHASQSFRKKRIRIKLRYGEAIVADNTEELIAKSKEWIENQLIEMNN